jgi:hypothetical protein
MIMKKITLLVASILLAVNVAKASEIIINAGVEMNMRHSFDEPISFVERGIEFFVFPNGDFDFNTRPQDSQGDYFYRKAGGRQTSGRGVSTLNYGTLIEHDSFGRVRRVGNTFINYDGRDRVNRIGTVYMRYNRFALAQIGGMQFVYNRRGEIVDTIGSVKGFRNQGFVYNNNNYDINYYNGYSSNYSNGNTNSNNSSNGNNNYYYYKKDGTKGRITERK